MLRVDDGAAGLEGGLSFLQGDADLGACGKGTDGIDETAAGTEVRRARGEARAGFEFDDFGGGGEHVPGGPAAFGFKYARGLGGRMRELVIRRVVHYFILWQPPTSCCRSG